MESDLGVTPNNDGSVIRLPFPALTEDRRRELVKQCKEYAEEARVAIRNARRDGEQPRSPSPSRKTTFPRTSSAVPRPRYQKLTDKYVAEVDAVFKKKEAEVMENYESGVRPPANPLLGAAGAPAHRVLMACAGAAGCCQSAQPGRRWGAAPFSRPTHLRFPRNSGSQPGCAIRLL